MKGTVVRRNDSKSNYYSWRVISGQNGDYTVVQTVDVALAKVAEEDFEDAVVYVWYMSETTRSWPHVVITDQSTSVLSAEDEELQLVASGTYVRMWPIFEAYARML